MLTALMNSKRQTTTSPMLKPQRREPVESESIQTDVDGLSNVMLPFWLPEQCRDTQRQDKCFFM